MREGAGRYLWGLPGQHEKNKAGCARQQQQKRPPRLPHRPYPAQCTVEKRWTLRGAKALREWLRSRRLLTWDSWAPAQNAEAGTIRAAYPMDRLVSGKTCCTGILPCQRCAGSEHAPGKRGILVISQLSVRQRLRRYPLNCCLTPYVPHKSFATSRSLWQNRQRRRCDVSERLLWLDCYQLSCYASAPCADNKPMKLKVCWRARLKKH